MRGTVAKIGIKYKRTYLTFKEYLGYLIKLKLLDETFLYENCVNKNIKVFPIPKKANVINCNDVKIFKYEEEIKKVKEKVENSNWKKDPSRIEDFLNLYNLQIDKEERDKFLDKDPNYIVFLPYYSLDKMIEPISFIGELSKPKSIKLISSYFSFILYCSINS